MKYEILYQNLLIQLKNRIPQNPKLVAKLADVLSIERMAVYRRLRQEVPFTFEEIIAIAKEFNISLDNMLGIGAKTTLPFLVQPHKNENSIEVDYPKLEEYLQAIKDLASDSTGEISLVTNLLPQLFYFGFKNIYRFYYFKWRYYTIPSNQTKSYHEIVLSDRLIQIISDIFVQSREITTCYYILDRNVFHDFVSDVAYFNSIRLINDEDIIDIKADLFRFLDYMETIAINGYIDKPSNKVFIYISETSIGTSFSCVDSNASIRFALVCSYIFNSILSYDENTFTVMRNRIRSIIRTSTLLSVTGEIQRTQYFDAQRKIVEQL